MDAKGRIAIPARHRDALHKDHNGTVIITVDIKSPCLLVYPLHEWEVLEQKLMRMSDTDTLQRSIKRKLLGYAQECELDSHGRFVIPPVLRSFANLDKKTMLVGLLNKFELWDEAVWQQEMQLNLELINTHNLDDVESLKDFTL